MTLIVEGMTATEYILALNNNFPSKDKITFSMLSEELISTFNSNYDYVKNIDVSIPARLNINVGQRVYSFIQNINQNCKNIDDNQPYTKIEHSIELNRGSEYGMLLDINYEPSILRLENGADLIGCLSRGGTTFNRENFNIIRNTDGVYSAPNLVGYDVSTAGTFDSHGKAAYIEKDGIVYCFHEKLVGVSATNSGGHNSTIYVKKSEDGGATWSYITSIGDNYAYPKVQIINGIFYLFVRGDSTISNCQYKISCYKSVDDCANWIELVNPYVTLYTTGSYFRSYHTILSGVDEINLVINERNDTIGTYFPWPVVFHFRSYDGITYYNSDRSWSKNIVADGSITRAEAIEHCLISDHSHGDDYTAVFLGGFVKNDTLYSLVGYGATSAGTVTGTGYSKTTFQACTLYENFTELIDLSSVINGIIQEGYAADTFLRLMRNGDTFDILNIDLKNNNDVKLYNYSSTALLSTKLLRTGETDNQKITIGSQTRNAITRSERIMVMGNVTGSMSDLYNSYTDLIIFENK